MSRVVLLLMLACFVATTRAHAQSSIALRGELNTDAPATSIRVVLEDSKGALIGETTAGADGKYALQIAKRGEYRLVVWIDGKKQSRRTFEVVCRPGTAMNKHFFYGKNDPTLMFSFPVEDPDVVDAAELHGDYPRDVLKEYEKSYEDYIGENFGRAIQRLEEVVARAPGFYGAHARLGMIYQQNGCYSDAEAAYVIAAALSPRSAQPLLNLASLQIVAAEESDDPKAMLAKALENVGKALTIKHNAPVAHALAGAASVKAGAYDDAEASFKRALEIDTDMPAGRLMLANLYMCQERWDDAIEHLDEYLKEHPMAPDRSAVKRMRTEVEKRLAQADRPSAPRLQE